MRATSRFVPAIVPALALGSLLVLTGCTTGSTGGTGGGATQPVAGGTLVYATGDAEPDCLDPHVGGNYPQALVATQYLESLVSLDEDGQVIPWLAEEWTESADGLTWEFTLRDDVAFTDGTALDAASVVANIEHLQDPETGSSTGYLALEKVTGAEAISDAVVRLTLSRPDSALLESLSQPWLAIQSAEALARPAEENCESPVGTGPFVVTAWNRQESIELERNDDYSSPPADAGAADAEDADAEDADAEAADAEDGGGPYLDAIEWRFVPDSATRYAALASGEVDVIDNAQPATIIAAEDDDAIDELDAPRPGASNRLELNSQKVPFDDERVREAFVRAADVDAGIEGLFFDTAERSYSPLSSVEPLALGLPELFALDTDAANRLLDDAGWTERDADGIRLKNGVPLTVVFPVSTNQSIPAEQSLFEQLQATTREVGFDVQLELLDLSSWYGALGTSEYDLVSAPYTKVGPDVLRILFDSSGITPAPSGYFANHAKVAIPELDDLLRRASEETDAATREQLTADAQRIVLEGYYILPLYDQQNHFLHRSDVEGMRAMPTVSTPAFANAWLDR